MSEGMALIKKGAQPAKGRAPQWFATVATLLIGRRRSCGLVSILVRRGRRLLFVTTTRGEHRQRDHDHKR